MPVPPAPLVTVGIPLYRARPFVDRIVRNIEEIGYPAVEFILADQHGLDDALEVLQERLGDRPGVRFIATRDELTWFDNYSFLFRQASGTYFRLLSQDDRILPGSISHAVEALEAQPSAVLAYGPVEAVDVDGRQLTPDLWCAGHSTAFTRRWNRFHSVAVYAGSRYRGATFGLIRRSASPTEDPLLPETYGHTGLSFLVWVFGLSLRGPFCLVPGYVSARCVHPESFTSQNLTRSVKDRALILWSYFRAGLEIWRGIASGFFERWITAPILLALATIAIPILRLVRLDRAKTLRRLRLR